MIGTRDPAALRAGHDAVAYGVEFGQRYQLRRGDAGDCGSTEASDEP